MKPMPKLVFVHRGEAMYPMNKSLRAYLADRVECFDETPETATARPDIGECVCWHVMGMQRKSLPCKFTIHDYRSLSVGRFRGAKDWIKRHFNAIPDARVSKPEIEAVMKFRDDVDTVLIDISVSDSVLQYRKRPSQKPLYDFGYVGVMSRERGFENVLKRFLDGQQTSRTILLIGRVEDGIDQQFADADNIIFTGPLPQNEVFERLADVGVALGYFPNHAPHIYQTPTKLLEYGALGMRILCNEQPMNRARAKDYGLNAVWRNDDNLFENLPSLVDWPDNYLVDPEPLLFSTHYAQSGLESLLERAFAGSEGAKKPVSDLTRF